MAGVAVRDRGVRCSGCQCDTASAEGGVMNGEIMLIFRTDKGKRIMRGERVNPLSKNMMW